MTVFFFSIEGSNGGFDIVLDQSIDNFIILRRSVDRTVFEEGGRRRGHGWNGIGGGDWLAIRSREVGHCQHSCVDFGDLLIGDRRGNWKRRGR